LAEKSSKNDFFIKRLKIEKKSKELSKHRIVVPIGKVTTQFVSEAI
jgi:hypothetical protein